jgi:hypothetical protein
MNTEVMVEAIALCLIDRADLALTAISVPGFTRKNRCDIKAAGFPRKAVAEVVR